jgi:hypothetical protein
MVTLRQSTSKGETGVASYILYRCFGTGEEIENESEHGHKRQCADIPLIPLFTNGIL